MPIYEYQCRNCDKNFERLVFPGDENSISCPECDETNVRKKMSASSFMTNSLGKCASTANPSKGFS